MFRDCVAAVQTMETFRWSGRVRELAGLVVASDGPAAGIGDFCEIQSSQRSVRAQVVGFRDVRAPALRLKKSEACSRETW